MYPNARLGSEIRGAYNPNSRFREEDIWVIRRLGDLYWHSRGREGKSPREMAQFYHVSAESIRRIVRRETWNWVREEPTGTAKAQDLTAKADSLTNLIEKGLVPVPSGMTKEAFIAQQRALILGEPDGSGTAKLQSVASNSAAGVAKELGFDNTIPPSPLDE